MHNLNLLPKMQSMIGIVHTNRLPLGLHGMHVVFPSIGNRKWQRHRCIGASDAV